MNVEKEPKETGQFCFIRPLRENLQYALAAVVVGVFLATPSHLVSSLMLSDRVIGNVAVSAGFFILGALIGIDGVRHKRWLNSRFQKS